MTLLENRPQRVVRIVRRSTDHGRTWETCEVLSGSPLATMRLPDAGTTWWHDGWGNSYQEVPE